MLLETISKDEVPSWVPTTTGGVEKDSEVAPNLGRKGHHHRGVRSAAGAEDSRYAPPPSVSRGGAGDTALVGSRPHTMPAAHPETGLGVHRPLKTQRTPARLQTGFHQRRQHGWTPN